MDIIQIFIFTLAIESKGSTVVILIYFHVLLDFFQPNLGYRSRKGPLTFLLADGFALLSLALASYS